MCIEQHSLRPRQQGRESVTGEFGCHCHRCPVAALAACRDHQSPPRRNYRERKDGGGGGGGGAKKVFPPNLGKCNGNCGGGMADRSSDVTRRSGSVAAWENIPGETMAGWGSRNAKARGNVSGQCRNAADR